MAAVDADAVQGMLLGAVVAAGISAAPGFARFHRGLARRVIFVLVGGVRDRGLREGVDRGPDVAHASQMAPCAQQIGEIIAQEPCALAGFGGDVALDLCSPRRGCRGGGAEEEQDSHLPGQL